MVGAVNGGGGIHETCVRMIDVVCVGIGRKGDALFPD